MKKKLKIIDDSHLLLLVKRRFSQIIDLDSLNQYTQNLYSNSSLLAMRSDWNRYIDHCYKYSTSIFPLQPDNIRHFLESESEHRKYSSIRRYSITISTIYRLLGEPDPLRDSQIRQLMMKLRLDKRGDQKQSDAFTSIYLTSLHQFLSKSTKKQDIRDLAIYYIMFECALKRADLRNMIWEQIRKEKEHIKLCIKDHEYELSIEAEMALLKWENEINDDSNYVFRAIDRHHNISKEKLNDSSIFRIFRKAAILLELPSLKFSGQSARIGAALELHKQGKKISDIQHFGRWVSPVMPSQYVGNVTQSEHIQLRYKRFKPWD